MDDKDKSLYAEENLQALKGLKKSVDKFLGVLEGKIEIKQSINVDGIKITELPEVNTEKEVAVNNIGEFAEAVKGLSDGLAQAIKDNAHKPLSEVTIKNLKDAHQKEIKVSNLNELKAFINQIAKAIAENQPIVNLEKQDIRFPRSASQAIPVRLSDGKSFYNAIASAVSGAVAMFKNSDGRGVQVQLTDNGAVPVDIQDAEVTINGDVTISEEVEIKNDANNPVPVSDTDGTAKLANIETNTGNISNDTAAIATYLDTVETKLQAIGDNTDGLEGLLTSIRDNADGVETLLTAIRDNTDQLEGYTDGLEGYVDQLEGFVDQLEGYIDTVEAKLQSLIDNTATTSTWDHGSNLDVDTSAEQLPSQAATKGVTVKAAATNTAAVYVGKSDVTAGNTDATDGFPLEPGESITLPLTNANLIYVIAASNNQKIFWVAA